MSTKAKPELHDKNIRQFVSELGVHFLSAVFENFASVRSGHDIEALHDMRVATRRLRETLQLFRSFYPPARFKKIIAKIRKTTQILGLPREMDVNVDLLRALQPSGGLVVQTTYEHLRASFEADQLRLRQKMLKAFEKQGLKKLEPELHKLVEGVLSRNKTHLLVEEHQDSELQRYQSEISKLLLDKARPVLEFSVTEENLKDEPALHKLRITVKKLRYTFEILKPLQPTLANDSLIAHCKTLQDILGDLHDRIVLIARIQNHQAQIAAKGFLLLDHGCSRIVSEFMEEKAALAFKIKPAHAQLIRALSEYLQLTESTQTLSAREASG